MKKYIGYVLWLLAFIIPFRSSFLETSEVGNMPGLFSFLAVLALLFAGYALVDSASADQAREGQH